MFTIKEALVICGFAIRGFDSFDSHPILQETKLLFMYRMSQIKTNEMNGLLLSHFWPLLEWASFLMQPEQYQKIGSSLKPNHHNKV